MCRALIVVLVVLTSFSTLSFGQVQAFDFARISREQGLSQGNVTCIVQDKKGFMWFGTRDGLNRFDGYGITVFRHNAGDSTTISHNYIRSLYCDKAGRLWIGTESGLNVYVPEKESFKSFKTVRTSNSSVNKIKAIIEDRKGNLWIGSAGGLRLFKVHTEEFIMPEHFSVEGIVATDIEDIAEDRAGNIVVATWNDGLYVITPDRTARHYTSVDGDQRTLGSDFLKKIYVDRSGKIWIGTTKGGLNLFDLEREVFTRFRKGQVNGVTSDDVLAISEDNQGRLWIGTQNGGINLLDSKRNLFSYIVANESKEKGLSSGSIYSIYRDKDSNMWVGTFSAGVNFWANANKKFDLLLKGDHARALNNSNALCVLEDKAGRVMIGTDGGGINVFNKQSGTVEYITLQQGLQGKVKSNYPLCFYRDSGGLIWIGSFYGQVSVYNPARKRFDHLALGSDVDHVSAICEDSKGRMWFGTWGQGLIAYDKNKKKFQRYIPSDKEGTLSHQIIFSIYNDRQSKLWIGTEGGGLNLFDPVSQKFTVFKAANGGVNSLSNNIVNCIFESKRGELWIGTHGGLNKLDRATMHFSTLRMKDGMASDVVQAILEDDHGKLWISTNQGITRFNPDTNEFRNYDDSDGLQPNSFNRLSAFKNNNGVMYFGGVAGLNIFHPDSIRDNTLPPPVHFTALQIFNKPVRFGSDNSTLETSITESNHLTLSYKQSVFSLEFVALNYTFPEKNQYAYKLEGFDDEWNNIGTQRKATYTNLHPGNYVLKVRASNNDGIWNDVGATMNIIIIPPFWQTWWAKTFYILVLIGLIIGLRGVFIQRMRVRNRLEMDEMKLRFYANISHEFRTPLTLILGPLNELKDRLTGEQSQVKLIDLMHRNGVRLHKLINQAMHIYELDAGFTRLKVSRDDLVTLCRSLKESFQYESEKQNIAFTLEVSADDSPTFFDKDKVEKIILNLLSNSFKYTSPGGCIKITLTVAPAVQYKDLPAKFLKGKKKAERWACVAVGDNGIGIAHDSQPKIFDRFFRADDSREGTGIGLALAQQLALSHYGEILVKSEQGKGSTFTLWLPINEEAYAPDDIAREPASAGSISYPQYSSSDPTPSLIQESPLNRATLLIVDDSEDIRQYLKHILSLQFNIETASDGAEGLDAALKIIPDIIISDVMMPQMDGIEMVSKLKRDLRTSHIPVVLLTARANEEFQLNAFENSLADDYITKPFNAGILLAKIRNMISLREALKRKLFTEFLGGPSEPVIPELDKIFLKKAIQVVERHMEDAEFDVEQFSLELGMSQTNIYRKLQSLLGIATNQFIKDVRMKRAAQLLESGQYSVAEVAYRVGFADPKYFSQVFKKHFKVLPTAFVASLKSS